MIIYRNENLTPFGDSTQAAAKLAQVKADEDGQKAADMAAEAADASEEKMYKDMEKALLEALLPPAAE